MGSLIKSVFLYVFFIIFLSLIYGCSSNSIYYGTIKSDVDYVKMKSFRRFTIAYGGGDQKYDEYAEKIKKQIIDIYTRNGFELVGPQQNPDFFLVYNYKVGDHLPYKEYGSVPIINKILNSSRSKSNYYGGNNGGFIDTKTEYNYKYDVSGYNTYSYDINVYPIHLEIYTGDYHQPIHDSSYKTICYMKISTILKSRNYYTYMPILLSSAQGYIFRNINTGIEIYYDSDKETIKKIYERDINIRFMSDMMK